MASNQPARQLSLVPHATQTREDNEDSEIVSCHHPERVLSLCFHGLRNHWQENSETELQGLTTKHRDVWLMAIQSQDHQPLSQSSIKSIKKGADGWHVTFSTETGGGPGEE